MRHLATVQKIKSVEPIEGADRIELVKFEDVGWQCVVKKGEFKVGDLCVYFEIDSFLPVRPEFEFLRSSSYKVDPLLGEGFRLKSQKLRGTLSQGLVLPLTLGDPNNAPFVVGMDVTDLLGVRKWEPYVKEYNGSVNPKRTPRPDFIKKTNECRIQQCPKLIEEFRGVPYYISTKCDGSSHSIGIDTDGVFHMTSHNIELFGEDGVFQKFVKEHNLESKLRTIMFNCGLTSIVVQGELCGPKIQKNRLGLDKVDWFIFTVDMDGKRQNLNILKAVSHNLGVNTVPIEEEGDDLTSKYDTVEKLLLRADGEYKPGFRKEGIVIRPKFSTYSQLLHEDLSMKVVSNKYLLKNED